MALGKRMTVPEMNEFTGNVGRAALFAELRQMKEDEEWRRQVDRWYETAFKLSRKESII